MKYIKLYEELNTYYRVLHGDEYDNILGYPKMISALNLNYTEQEEIINVFKTRFEVKESLDDSEWIDNAVVIGFNRIEQDVSCWLNIKIVKTKPPTKKWMKGRRSETSHEIVVSKLDDEWFLVRGVMGEEFKTKGSEEAKCDQLSGLLKYFKDKIIDI